MKRATYLGAKPRFSDRELRARVEECRRAVDLVAFEHPQRRQILDAFVEVYREMEGDERLDGACHLLAAHAHVVLGELEVTSELHVGEVAWTDGTNVATGSHSWVEVDGLRFDVAAGRPLTPNPVYDVAPVLGTTEIPSGRQTTAVYNVDGVLDEPGELAAAVPVGVFVAGLREHGVDFWAWVERTCRRMKVAGARAERLRTKYGRSARWVRRDPGAA